MIFSVGPKKLAKNPSYIQNQLAKKIGELLQQRTPKKSRPKLIVQAGAPNGRQEHEEMPELHFSIITGPFFTAMCTDKSWINRNVAPQKKCISSPPQRRFHMTRCLFSSLHQGLLQIHCHVGRHRHMSIRHSVRPAFQGNFGNQKTFLTSEK